MNVIQTRRSYVPGAVPTSDSLVEGQLAVNISDKLMFIADPFGNIVSLGGAGQVTTYTGDVTGSGTTSVGLTLAASGVAAGTYTKVTVDVKGRVIAGTNPTTLAGYGITNAYTKAQIDVLNTFALTLPSSDPNQLIDAFDINLVKSAKYEMQIVLEGGLFVHVSELRVMHNGTVGQFVEYGILYSDSILATFSVEIIGSDLRLLVSPINTDTSFRFRRTVLTQ